MSVQSIVTEGGEELVILSRRAYDALLARAGDEDAEDRMTARLAEEHLTARAAGTVAFAPDWLTARPVAHRGLHDRARGIVENMPSAVTAAIAGNFAIEVDIQLSADGEAMVHHDYVLGRLTDGQGELLNLTAAQLQQVPFKDTTERMMTLGDLCDLAAGRVDREHLAGWLRQHLRFLA